MTRRHQLWSNLRGPMIWMTLVGLLAVASVKTDQTTAPVVEINGGQVKGLVRNTADGHRVNLYQGIRYGRAERFRKPAPVEPWTGIYEATKEGNECPQFNFNMPIFRQNLDRMSEDCLFLDVWQPAANSTQKRSVMVWIHGGDFIAGSINQYDLAQFAGQGDVVVVSINYRLCSLAFVNGGTELEPGNLALYDQILALEWVQQNVDQFGGNPLDVTIFAESHGSWSVGLLSVSPLTEGLFHRAILQSGEPNKYLFAQTREESLQKTLEFAREMDCLEEDDDGQNIEQSLAFALNCLREIPANDLIQVAIEFEPYHGDQLLPLKPTEALGQIDRKLDILFGVTRDEGIKYIGIMYPTIDLNDNITLDLVEEIIQKMAKKRELPNADLVMEHYTGHLTQDSSKDEIMNALFNVYGDYMVVCPTILTGKPFSRQHDFNTAINYYAYRLMTPLSQDLPFLFDIDIMGEKPKNSETFAKVHHDIARAWTEFAKTGKISGVEETEAIDRKQPEQSSIRYYSLDPADYNMDDGYWKELCEQVWRPNLSNPKKTDKVNENQSTAPLVEIKGGLVRGWVRNTVDGNQVNLYQGIRYGRAKRFRKPTPVEPWTGIYDATEIGYECPQPNLNMPMFRQNLDRMGEDCLFLDVWQPAAKSAKKRSVMVWIHGGSFMIGSINQYDLARFVGQGDVVVVSINYRLGSLAFVNGGTKKEPGNLALYDQVLALEWVQQNVDQFGGNPQDVTIFGESAGGWAIGLLTLSPLTEGLFHRAILQSGELYLYLFTESKEKSLQKTLEFARKMDCLEEDDDGQNIEQSLASALSCLREKSANDLIQIPLGEIDQSSHLGPHHGDQMLPLYTGEALQQFDRKLDLMFGVDQREAFVLLWNKYREFDLYINMTQDSVRKIIRMMTKEVEMSNVDLVMEHYTKHLTKDSSDDELRNALFNAAGDYLYVCPTIFYGKQFARLLGFHKDSHIYAYRLMTPLSMDLPFLFDIDILGQKSKNSETFAKLHHDLLTTWTEFAKTGMISGVEGTEAIDRKQPEQSPIRYYSLNPADYNMVDGYWKELCEQFWKPKFFNSKKTKKEKKDKKENVKTEL